MSFELILFIIIHLIAFIYFIEMLRRIFKRAHEYELEDTHETLPFGFVRLRHVVIAYILGYLVWIVFSIVLYLYFVGGAFSLGGSALSPNDVILDL